MSNLADYGFEMGDIVSHVKDPSLIGVVIEIDRDADMGGVTTARVVWGEFDFELASKLDRNDSDIVWTNKLQLHCSD